jgi:hypothetical protein
MRRTYLINRRLQFKYALMIGAVLAVVVILMEAHAFLVIRMIGPEFENPILLEPLKSLQLWMLASGLIIMLSSRSCRYLFPTKLPGPCFGLKKPCGRP